MKIIPLLAAASFTLSACANMTPGQKIATGTLLGATAGLMTANSINANKEWTILTVLAGAAAGTVVARNNAINACAFALGDGTYYTAACPEG